MTKSYILAGMYHLTVGELYEEGTSCFNQECLKEIKEELEAIHGVKIHMATTENQLIYVCQNGLSKHQTKNQEVKYGQIDIEKQTAGESPIDHSELFSNTQICSYFIHFSIEFRIGRPVYKLKNFNMTHSATCKDQQEAFFLRNKRLLSSQKGAIMKIVSHKRAKGEECNNPTSVLNILCDEIGLDSSFLYKDVKHETYKRKLKKKLDNLIAQAKKAQINPSHYGFKSDQIDNVSWANANEQALTKQRKNCSQMQKREKVRENTSKSNFFAFQNHKTAQNYQQKVQSCTSLLSSSEIDLQDIDPNLISIISAFGVQNFDFAFGVEPPNQNIYFQDPTEMIAEYQQAN